MTWDLVPILTKLPPICDMDSHGNCVSFHVTNRGQFVIKIDTQSHDYSMSFIHVLSVSMLEYDMDFGQVQVMEFPRHLLRNDGTFHIRYRVKYEIFFTAMKEGPEFL